VNAGELREKQRERRKNGPAKTKPGNTSVGGEITWTSPRTGSVGKALELGEEKGERGSLAGSYAQ